MAIKRRIASGRGWKEVFETAQHTSDKKERQGPMPFYVWVSMLDVRIHIPN